MTFEVSLAFGFRLGFPTAMLDISSASQFERLNSMASSRHRGVHGSSFCVSDIVPPGHAQLIVVLYPTAEAFGYHYSMRYGERLECESAHVPEIDTRDELHRPFFVGCDR